MTHFSILKSGMPYRSKPPIRSAFSNSVTVWPARASCCAAARPAGPEPTMATDLPVFPVGRIGCTSPSLKPRSMMFHSMMRIDTGSLLIPSTQADSQGAGQRRPVNSGKLLVVCSALSALPQRPRCTRSFHSGMRFTTGQPCVLWQNGTPQSMQRAPWVWSFSSEIGS